MGDTWSRLFDSMFVRKNWFLPGRERNAKNKTSIRNGMEVFSHRWDIFHQGVDGVLLHI